MQWRMLFLKSRTISLTWSRLQFWCLDYQPCEDLAPFPIESQQTPPWKSFLVRYSAQFHPSTQNSNPSSTRLLVLFFLVSLLQLQFTRSLQHLLSLMNHNYYIHSSSLSFPIPSPPSSFHNHSSNLSRLLHLDTLVETVSTFVTKSIKSFL